MGLLHAKANAKLSADWDALLEDVYFPKKAADENLPPGAGQIRAPSLRQLIKGDYLDEDEQALLARAWKPTCDAALVMTKDKWQHLRSDLRKLRPLLLKKWSGPQFVHRAEVMCARAYHLYGNGDLAGALNVYRAVFILGQLASRGVPAVSQFTDLAALRIGVRVKEIPLGYLSVLLNGKELSSEGARSISKLLAELEHTEAPFTLAFSPEERLTKGIELPAVGEVGFHKKFAQMPNQNIKRCLNYWLSCRTKLRGLQIVASLKASGKDANLYLEEFRKNLAQYPKDPASNEAFCTRSQDSVFNLYGRGLNGEDDGGEADDVDIWPLR